MYRFHRIERHCEISRVLHINDQFGMPMRWNRAHRTELLTAIRREGLKPNFDFLLHDLLLGTELVRPS